MGWQGFVRVSFPLSHNAHIVDRHPDLKLSHCAILNAQAVQGLSIVVPSVEATEHMGLNNTLQSPWIGGLEHQGFRYAVSSWTTEIAV